MEKCLVILLFLAPCFLEISQGFSEDNWLNNENDYLEYIASKRRQIEDALLRERPTRDLYSERDLNPYASDKDDDDDAEQGRYSFRDEDDEEGEEEDERIHRQKLERTKKREERIERLQKESNNIHSPNHVLQNNPNRQSDKNEVQKKTLKSLIMKKSPKTKNKSVTMADKNQTKASQQETEAISKEQPGISKKEQIHKDLTHKDQAETEDTVKKSSPPHGDKTVEKESDAKFAAKDKPEDESENSNVALNNPSAVNKSAPTPAPRVAPFSKVVAKKKNLKKLDKALFIMVVAACGVAGVAGLVLASYCWYRLRKQTDDAPEEKYEKSKSGKKKKERKPEMTDDEKLAKGAEVYHYMHARKQLAAMEKGGTQKKADIADSDSSDEESDNTVYECPGLAPPGDMKVVNPLFSDAEREHSDARSDGSHMSSPTADLSSPPRQDQPGPSNQ